MIYQNEKSVIKLYKTSSVPKVNDFMYNKVEVLSFSLNEDEKVSLSLYPDNVLEVCIINKETKIVTDVFDTGINIANYFCKFEVNESELIYYVRNVLKGQET